ncbi:MAG: allantoinase [Chloroflexi bacterium GWC2_73_18]|nr:MAG: allantoinase [Chloroflexi bacterium GWC2_73_18]
MTRTLITGGLVVCPGGAVRADLLVSDGRIAGLADPPAGWEADERINADGLVVLPGAIDGHTHFMLLDPELGEPDPDEFEGFTNGGRGAAAGGVTTCVEMPQGFPPATNGLIHRRKRELAERDAIVDFALWGGVRGGQTAQEVFEQIDAGAAGFKALMCNSDPTFAGVDDAQLLATLEVLRETPLMLGLHAESDALLQNGLRRMAQAGRRDPLAHAESRPPMIEIEAVNRAVFFAEQTGGWVHIIHLSTPEAAELIGRARSRGVRATCETCPQYLVLDLDDLARLGPYARCAPAIRDRGRVERMWEYVADGTIDAITSDHCGFTVESKERGRADIFAAPNGLTGIQTLLPLVVSEGRRRGLSWERIAELTATGPARLWQLAPRKGAIRLGADADLVLLDPERVWTVHPGELLHTHRWTPYEGRQLRGRVVRTLVRGVTVYRDDAPERILVEPGFGRFVPAQATATAATVG